MKTRRLTLAAVGILASAGLITGCSTADDAGPSASPSSGQSAATSSSQPASESGSASESASGGGHGHMDHKMDGGPAPEGIAEAASPAHPVGSEVTLTADHMPGMDGATATITGAFDTTTYAVDYTPTTGGEPVKDHKWVVHEELQDAGDAPLQVGDTAVMEAEHMAGMKGAEATVASVTDETVYMVDYTADGMTMTNHKWVVESEIQPKG